MPQEQLLIYSISIATIFVFIALSVWVDRHSGNSEESLNKFIVKNVSLLRIIFFFHSFKIIFKSYARALEYHNEWLQLDMAISVLSAIPTLICAIYYKRLIQLCYKVEFHDDKIKARLSGRTDYLNVNSAKEFDFAAKKTNDFQNIFKGSFILVGILEMLIGAGIKYNMLDDKGQPQLMIMAIGAGVLFILLGIFFKAYLKLLYKFRRFLIT